MHLKERLVQAYLLCDLLDSALSLVCSGLACPLILLLHPPSIADRLGPIRAPRGATQGSLHTVAAALGILHSRRNAAIGEQIWCETAACMLCLLRMPPGSRLEAMLSDCTSCTKVNQ